MVGRANNCVEPGSFLKTDTGAVVYWTPEEAFALALPGEAFRAEELVYVID